VPKDEAGSRSLRNTIAWSKRSAAQTTFVGKTASSAASLRDQLV
jgi:hypothetical protein